ncbi:MarR family winged helix-turn-helix transcriptional regulator [Nocardiopsis ganjiahuensis]|uniref:MarR family winged helix-turn-helix transcriptional regulator n=1 Tax=Nocardiopsis ganjiahuensis TaxID=239984 RepID=UPI00034B8408|nr:MarR family transcriptional regulator [Nocardiopsis ganjiahuensis]
MSEANEGVSPLWHLTGFRLIKLGELVQATTASVFEAMELNARQFHVLATAATMAEPSQRELSRTLGIDPNVMVGVVDELERLELVERVRNPQDRRRYIVTPTLRALEVLARAQAAVARTEEEFFAGISEEERRVLHELSGRLIGQHPRVTKSE